MRFIIDFPFFFLFFFFFLFIPSAFCADFSPLAFSELEGLLLKFRFLDKLLLCRSLFKLLVGWGSWRMLLIITLFTKSNFDLLSFLSVSFSSAVGASDSVS